MLVFLTLVYLSRNFAQAAPLPFPEDATTSPPVYPLDLDGACPDKRTVWGIVWSCLTTIFACSWLSIHPNMPAPGEVWWKRAFRRLELMFWALIAPEMIIVWAMRQWYGARRIAKEFHGKGWTMTHGYFMQMGGFMLFYNGEAKEILSPERLKKLYDDGQVEFPSITEDEIQDRSKANALAKTFVLVQTTWFIAQCLARGAQGLVLIELELVTLAFAFLNGFIYFLWWKKPLDAECSLAVYLLEVPGKRDFKQKKNPSLDNDTRSEFAETTPIFPTHFRQIIIYLILSITAPILHSAGWICGFIQTNSVYLFKIVHSVASSFRHGPSRIWKFVNDEGLSKIFHQIFLFLPKCCMTLIKRLSSMSGGSTTCVTTRAATFDAHHIQPIERAKIIAITALMASAFGAIHCVGWFFAFASSMEAIFWRSSSVIITVVPLCMFCGGVCDSINPHKHSVYVVNVIEAIVNAAKKPPLRYLVLCGAPLYVVARLILLIQACTGLRNLSPAALAVVHWTNFIPHV